MAGELVWLRRLYMMGHAEYISIPANWLHRVGAGRNTSFVLIDRGDSLLIKTLPTFTAQQKETPLEKAAPKTRKG